MRRKRDWHVQISLELRLGFIRGEQVAISVNDDVGGRRPLFCGRDLKELQSQVSSHGDEYQKGLGRTFMKASPMLTECVGA